MLRRPESCSALRAALLLVAVALVVGLPRFLVLCSPAAGTPHVELACSADCGHAAAGAAGAADHAADGAPRATPQAGPCVHVALGCELAPTPPDVTAPPPDPEATGEPATLGGRPRHGERRALAWADATGPPRPKPILHRIASTVLRQ